MEPLTVVVNGVPPGINPRKLISTLKQKSGGRCIKNVTKNGPEARVTFENLAALEEFCASAPFEIEFGGHHRLNVKRSRGLPQPKSLYSYPPHHVQHHTAADYDHRKKYYWDEIAEFGMPKPPGSRCLLVENTGEHQDGASIKRFFENERRSGGGPVRNIIGMHDGTLIVFEDDTRVENVLQVHRDHPLQFASNELILHRKTIPPFYLDRMVLMSSSKDSSVDEEFHMELYVEAKIRDVKDCSCQRLQNRHFLVTWKTPIDPAELHDAVRNISTKKDEVDKAFVLVRTDILEVKSTGEMQPIDLLRFFSNTRRSHGGPVTRVIQKSPNRSLVFFASYEDAENSEQHMNKQSHALIGSNAIEVKLYHRQFHEEDSEDMDGAPSSENKQDQLQAEWTFQWTPGEGEKEILAFIQKRDFQMACFQSNLDQVLEVDFTQDGLILFKAIQGQTLGSKKAFQEVCKNVTSDFMNKLAFLKRTFDFEKLTRARNIYEQLQENYFSKNPSDRISVLWSDTKVEIAGEKDMVEKTMKDFEEWILKSHTVTIKVPEEKARLLTESDAWEEMKVKVEEFGAKCLLESDNMIHIHGEENVTKFGKMAYESFVKAFSKTLLDGFDSEKRVFLVQVIQDGLLSEIKKTILSEIHKVGVKGTLTIDGNAIYLTSATDISQDQKRQTLAVLERVIVRKEIILDEQKMSVVKEKEWQELVDEVCCGSSVKIVLKDSFLIIVGLQPSVRNIEPCVLDHFEKNVIHEEMIPVNCGKARYIMERSKDFSQFQRKQRGITCVIVYKGLALKGRKVALEQAKADMTKLLVSIIEQEESVLTPGAFDYFHSDKGRECIRNTEVMNNVTIMMDSKICDDCQKHDQKEASGATAAPETSGLPSTFPLISGVLKRKRSVKLSVWKKDITEHACDAIINPTDDKRAMAGILSTTLIQKGGSSIEEQLKKAKKFHTGDAHLTSAGNLKSFKNIIHVAVPRWGDKPNSCMKQLQSCIDESLKLANKKGLKTLAYPALCCGKAKNTEVEEIIELIFKSVEDHLCQNGTFSVKELHFIERENETVIQKLISIANKTLRKNIEEVEKKVRPKSVSTSLVIGNIAVEQADAIVNTTTYVKEMNSGAISSALKKECGSAVLQECSKLQGSYPPGTVLETSGGNLKCKKLYHGITRSWDDQKSEEMVRDIVMKVLKKSDSSGFRSVAFPAIATGGFKYPPKKVAGWMKDEIESFCGTSLGHVKIVLYPTDAASIQAFENEFNQSGQTQSQVSAFPPTMPPLQSKGTRPKPVKYGCIEVSVYEGDITAEDSDVIVNSSNMRFDLSQGNVSKAILAKGGSQLQKEVKVASGTTFRMTSGGALPCKKIMHVYFSTLTQNELIGTLQKALAEIDSQNFTSVSIPALGTGMQSQSSIHIANLMLQCFQNFAKSNPVTLHQIKVVVFDRRMLADFQKILLNPPNRLTKMMGYVGLGEFWKGSNYNKPLEEDVQVEVKELELFLYSDDRKNIDKAFKYLTGELHKVCGKTVIPLQEEETLSARDLNYLKQAYQVTVELHETQYLNELVLSGMTENMVKAIPEIKEYIQAVTQAHKSLNDVVWKHSIEGNDWEAFSEQDGAVLEDEYQKRKLSNYTASKVYLGLASGKALDVDFNRSILLESPAIKILREELYILGSELPHTWEKCEHGEKGVPVDRHSEEYKKIRHQLPKEKFRNIVSVKRIQNRYLFSQFMAKKAEVEKKLKKYGSRNPVIRELYHGTTSSESILQNGFDRSYAGKNATVYGKGVYFAFDPCYSHRYAGRLQSPASERTLFIADVITGDYCLGTDQMSTPPPRNPRNTTELYDSLVDDEGNPTIFVVFKDASVYPKYLVTYT